MPRSLGLDVGDKRIGVAMSDPGAVLASPLTIIERRAEAADIAAVAAIIEQHDVKRVIAGLPRSMDGHLGHQAEKVQAFIDKLAGHIRVPIEFRDERLTTISAQRLRQEASTRKPRSKKRLSKKADDAIAAAIILQGYLDESLLADL